MLTWNDGFTKPLLVSIWLIYSKICRRLCVNERNLSVVLEAAN